MARSSPAPGPPPPHFRPPGVPASSGPGSWGTLPGNSPLGVSASPPTPPEGGLGPGAATIIAVVTLLIGIVIGFFAGRASESDDPAAIAPPLTSPSTSATTRPPGDTIPQTPSGDPGAPPSTDLDPTTIGSAGDPIPFGQAYVLGLYEIEVISVERDAAATLAEFNGAAIDPPFGRQHLIVEVAVRFTDASGVGNPASIPLFVSDGTGTWNDYDASCGAVPRSILGSGLIEQGDEAIGNACFTVPVDVVDSLMLGTEGFDGPVYFALPD
ncbi:hypothetical protein [Actinospongicola halichondriae]|uniref:hypothetical protein n=1 Tax=Actinospongicola halichondriae TaxID=3236844 RepID=UPI003D55F95A